ncbi:ABC transporter permease [Acuticoccus sp. MNP-M23]|uniref:ABC transporter permease n=1 Tax=Acuticoccus sp. MNP-M23 TaxID=3072793 RepID=UPI0028161F36|nr:ABC transporter permease [Acuticoccus sp. MNP-M23]WMS40973.1 ABC transporter permease [Acuticoccus sp. MNP-M23]
MATTTLSGTFVAQSRIIWTVATRLLQLKTRESPLGVFSSLIEPLAMILMMTLVFSTIRMRVPQAGDYLMLFFMTGIIAINVFKQGQMAGEQGYMRLRRVLGLPHVRPIDLMVSGIFTNTLVMISLFLGMTVFFCVVYDAPWPQNLMLSLAAPVCNSFIALGFASLNAVIKTWFKFWGVIWSTVTMPLAICSGMFYTAESMPLSVQKILFYNPILHSTEFVRSVYFEDYNSGFFSPAYYFSWVIGALVLGLLLERTFRYRLLNVKQ